MAINILDDDVIKRNRRLYSALTTRETNADPVEKTKENTSASFRDLYDEENSSAPIDPRESNAIEINIDNINQDKTSLKSNQEMRNENDVETINFYDDEGELIDGAIANEKNTYTVDVAGNRNLLSVETNAELRANRNATITKLRDREGNLIDPENAVEGIEYETIYIDTRERESSSTNLDANITSYRADGGYQGVETSNFYDNEGNIVTAENAGALNNITYTVDEAENRNILSVETNAELRRSSNVVITKLQDAEGNLIDPENAVEGIEYETVYVDTKGREKRSVENYPRENLEITFKGNTVGVQTDVIDNDITTINTRKDNISAAIGSGDLSSYPYESLQISFKNMDQVYSTDIETANDITGFFAKENLSVSTSFGNVQTGELGEFQYNQIYENDFWKANNWFGEGRAKLPENPIAKKTVSAGELEIRENLGGFTDFGPVSVSNNRMREMAIFLFMLFPYIGTSVVNNVRSAIDNPDPVGLAGSLMNTYFLLLNLRYFTPKELLLYFGHNFYTLHFFKQMTIKYPPGKFPSGVPDAEQWNGEPDLYFGQGMTDGALNKLKQIFGGGEDPSTDMGPDGSQRLTKYKDGGSDANEGPGGSISLAGGVDPRSPKLILDNGMFKSFYHHSPKGILNNKVDNKLTGQKEEYQYVVSVPLLEIDRNTGKWIIPFGRAPNSSAREEFNNFNDLENRDVSAKGKFDINPDVRRIEDNTFSTDDTGKWNAEVEDGKWNSSASQNGPTFNKNQIENREAEEVEEKYYIMPEVKRILDNSFYVEDTGKWKSGIENGKWNPEAEEGGNAFDKNKVENRFAELEEDNYYINPDVKNVLNNAFSVDQDTGKWKAQIDGGRWNEDAEKDGPVYDKRNIEARQNDLDESNYILNENVLNVKFLSSRLINDGEGWDNDGDGKVLTVKDAMKKKSQQEDMFQVGSILVAPITSNENNLERFYIPFEFNPDISEGDVAANYEATSVLSRIGEMYSYSNTGSLTITLETKYIAVSETGADDNLDGQSWMNNFTIKDIQGIEMAYRSLVLPHHPDETSENQGYKYVKPPILRVVMGSADDDQPDDGPYSNLLTYQSNSVVEGRLNSTEQFFSSNKKHLRNFIATGVSIKKSLNETPVRLDNKGRLLDTMGFDVSLNLTEISTSYMDALPDFKAYANQFISLTGNRYKA